jgi:DNA-binding FadR family transcriptional regulator
VNISRKENRGGDLLALRAFIAEGKYQPGDRLPAERELIERLSMSRTKLRHALEALEQEGAIWRHVGRGTFLAAGGDTPMALTFADIGRKLTPFKMMRARLAIEPAIARESAINASEEALEKILLASARNAHATDWAEYQASDDAFHRAIAVASDNPLLLALFDGLNQVKSDVTWENVTGASRDPQRLRESFSEHAQICDAIRGRDPVEAQDAMRRHIASVSARLFGEG